MAAGIWVARFEMSIEGARNITAHRLSHPTAVQRALAKKGHTAGMLDAIRIASILIVINAIAFLAFWWDKQAARAGARRIPESNLLWLAFLGGSAGSIAGQRLFRHKTQKEPFASRLQALAFLNLICAIGLLLVWLYAPEWIDGLTARLFAA